MKNILTINQHLQEPEIPPSKYIRFHHLKLGEKISNRKKIYLDTKYWLLFRDVISGNRDEKSLVTLFEHIRKAVKSGRAICPVSQDSFTEIFVQKDPTTLELTVRLLDELSLSVCHVDHFTRINTEIHHFFLQHLKGKEAVYELDRLLWTKCGYVLGYQAPRNNSFSREESDAMEKAFFDKMWTVTFADIFERLGCCPNWKVKSESVDDLNLGKFTHSGEIKTFKQLFLIEMAGALDTMKETLSRIFFQMYLNENENNVESIVNPDLEAGEIVANFLYNAFRLNKIDNELPTLTTQVTLHAAFRWNKGRKYKSNDLADIHHAVMALPYCDMFLTERSLCHLIHEKHLGLTKRFKCQTFSDPELALKYLKELDL